jgi:DNA-binding transcriptional LysR family regulator
MSDFDLDDIRRLDGGLLLVFRELLRHRRATTAARGLGLSQSAISHSLTRLRDLFGDPLFVRRPHGLEPTQRAIALGPRIETLIDLAGAALARGGDFDPAISDRRFNMSAPEFVTAIIGAPLVEIFRRSAPNATFAIGFQPQEAALESITHGEADLALGRFTHLRPGLRSEILFEDRSCVVARRKHPKIKGAISLAAYCETGHVFAYTPSEVSSDAILPSPRAVKAHAYVPGWLAALALVAASDAIATCPRRLAERQAKVMDLQILKTPFALDSQKVLAVRRIGASDAGADWLLDQIRRAVQ